MRLVDWLDKGASLGAGAPCLTMDGKSLSYAEVQALTHRVARRLNSAGITPGKHVAILSGNDPVAFACVLAISRAAAVWCPINPRNEAAEKELADIRRGTGYLDHARDLLAQRADAERLFDIKSRRG